MNLTRIETLELTLQFEAIFEAFPDILFKLSRDGKILSCKAGKSSLAYLDPEKHVGSHIKDILPAMCMEGFKSAVDKLSQVGDMACIEFPYETENKKYWFEARLVPFYKKQVLAILRDITDKKEIEASLLEEKLNIKGKDGILRALAGKFNSTETNHADESPLDEEALRAKIHEYNILTDKLNYEINLRRGMESTLKMHLEELKKRNKELEYFRYLASNDFQEPIRSITSFAKLLAGNYRNELDTEAHEMLDFIISGGEDMQRIVKNLSDYVSIAKTETPLELVHMEDQVIFARKQLYHKMEQKKAVLFFDDLPVITANKKLVFTLLEQLFDNALKFSRSDVQTEILVGAEKYPSHYEFYVKDNGIGFNMDFQERIFMLFQRLHPRSAYPGAGIGLAFCKRIVEHHGGEIWAESTPGEGSTFFFTMPC